MAAVLVIGPIFEVDLPPQQRWISSRVGCQDGSPTGLLARDAARVSGEVVDADLRDYFNSIPHAPLMRSLSRRIADGRLLHVIKRWLTAPVGGVSSTGGSVQTAEARRTKRGNPAGRSDFAAAGNC